MKKLFLFFLMLLGFNAHAAEEILKYHSDIKVNKDRSITVTETIVVNAEGRQIQRGIFRNIVTTAEDEKGRRVKYDLEIHEVLKNGQAENFAVSGVSLGKQLRIGDADVFLSPGQYTYTIKYTMSNQVRFFNDYDELYWNVTGNEWDFVIKEASATVVLPDSATILQHKGYSGKYGESGCGCDHDKTSPREITYTMTEPLYPLEGLTIAVGWNKGVIPPPTAAEIRKQALKSQMPLLIGIAGVLLIFLYYLFAWFKVGRDPEKGTIIPRFAPPHGFSPAAVRYVQQMGFDKKAFTASVVSMAIKGYLSIEKDGKSYKLKKLTEDKSNLSSGERKIARGIFKYHDEISIVQSNHVELMRAIRDLGNQLKVDFMKINFNRNVKWITPGIILSVLLGLGIAILNLSDATVFVSIIGSFFGLAFFIPIMIGMYQGSKNSYGASRYIFFLFFVAIPLGVVFLFYRFILEFDSDLTYLSHVGPFFLLIIGLIAINFIFFHLIKAPTVTGRKRMDEIEGLKMFMEVAEKHRFNKLNPPEMTPQLFEELLPYAIALNVENEWGEQFNSILEKAMQNNEYEPRWYRGGSGDVFQAHLLASALGSNFSSAISSASTSPQSSSSSGSSGGGFSGGGGGGGGGGGW